MVSIGPSRRTMLLALSAFAFARPSYAETVIDLDWKDLLPEGTCNTERDAGPSAA